MEVMTMTDTIGPRPGEWWSIDDLFQLPDDGRRYEILDGCLLVSPAPAPRHGKVVSRLHRLLVLQAPEDLAVGNDVGVQIGSNFSYFVPDLFVIPWAGYETHPKYLVPADVRLVIEVLSEHNGRDLVLKRNYYASVGIPRYWIVDPFECLLTALALVHGRYDEVAIVKPGTVWETDLPFPLELDPGSFLEA